MKRKNYYRAPFAAKMQVGAALTARAVLSRFRKREILSKVKSQGILSS
jgi:hypothetical protein